MHAPRTAPRYFDPRTTVEVQESRSMENHKPFRTKAQKVEARRIAIRVRGAFCSRAPVSHHSGSIYRND